MHENERNFVPQDHILSTLYSISDARKIRVFWEEKCFFYKAHNLVNPVEGINNVIKLGKFDTNS